MPTVTVNGTLKNVGQNKKGDWWLLKGDWDDEENATTQFVPVSRGIKELFEAGIVKQDGTWPDGGAKYTTTETPFSIEKTFHGKGKTPTLTFILGNGTAGTGGSIETAQPVPHELRPHHPDCYCVECDRMPVPAPVANVAWEGKPYRNDTPNPPPEQPLLRAVPAPAGSLAAVVMVQEDKPDPRWVVLAHDYHRCQRIAMKYWPEGTDPAVIQAATATILIEANKRGLIA